MRYCLQLAILACALILFAPTLTRACTCGSLGIEKKSCQFFSNDEAIFSGEVTDVSIISSKEKSGDREVTRQRKKFSFKISEAFRGVSGDSVDVMTGMGGGDCGVDFKVGESYLVYSYKNAQIGDLETGICLRNQLLAHAGEDLSYLRKLLTAPHGVNFYGVVMQTALPQSDGTYGTAPLPGISVTIEGEKGKHKLLTDKKGEYRLENMPAGEYQISIKTPEKLGGAGQPQKLEVIDKSCVFYPFLLQLKTELSGRLLDENSNPAAKIPISLIRVEALNSPRPADLILNATDTDQDGRFTFHWIPDGKYYLGVRLTGSSEKNFLYPQTFYPGTTNPAEAKPITITQGQMLENVDFKLPVKNKLRTVKGIVLYPDGRPVASADISVNETQYFYSYYFFSVARTKEDGTYSFEIVDGIKYTVEAMADLPNWEQRHADPVELPQNGDVSNLKFIINKPGGH